MKWFAESGLASYWATMTMPKVELCQLDNYAVASAEKRVLSLNDLMGPSLFNGWNKCIIASISDRNYCV